MFNQSHFARGAGLLLIFSVAAIAQPPGGFPGGRFEPPKPGEILHDVIQQHLQMTAEQQKQLAELQKDVDAKLGKILTADQKKSLQEMRDRRGPGLGPPGPFGGPGGFGPPGDLGTIRLDDVKKAVAATDEEWKVIGLKLQKVVRARQVLATEARSLDARAAAPPADGRRTDAPPRGDGPRPAPGTEANIITQAQADFKAVLDDPKHTPAQLEEAAAAVHKVRKKARTDLHAAQKDLRQLLTAEQETVLLGLGYFD